MLGLSETTKGLLESVSDNMPGWRNGRRCGLKIRCPKGRAGSTPALGTKQDQEPTDSQSIVTAIRFVYCAATSVTDSKRSCCRGKPLRKDAS
jgi:hypothetical protein